MQDCREHCSGQEDSTSDLLSNISSTVSIVTAMQTHRAEPGDEYPMSMTNL